MGCLTAAVVVSGALPARFGVAASFRRRLLAQLPEVRFHRPFGDSKTEPSAARFARPIVRTAVEPLEDPVPAFSLDSGTRVAHLQCRPAGSLGDAHADPAGLGCVFDRVAHQIDQRLSEDEVVANASGSAHTLDAQRLLVLFSQDAEVSGDGLGQFTQVDQLGCQLDFAGVRSRQGQQPFDETAQSVRADTRSVDASEHRLPADA